MKERTVAATKRQASVLEIVKKAGFSKSYKILFYMGKSLVVRDKSRIFAGVIPQNGQIWKK